MGTSTLGVDGGGKNLTCLTEDQDLLPRQSLVHKIHFGITASVALQPMDYRQVKPAMKESRVGCRE